MLLFLFGLSGPNVPELQFLHVCIDFITPYILSVSQNKIKPILNTSFSDPKIEKRPSGSEDSLLKAVFLRPNVGPPSIWVLTGI